MGFKLSSTSRRYLYILSFTIVFCLILFTYLWFSPDTVLVDASSGIVEVFVVSISLNVFAMITWRDRGGNPRLRSPSNPYGSVIIPGNMRLLLGIGLFAWLAIYHFLIHPFVALSISDYILSLERGSGIAMTLAAGFFVVITIYPLVRSHL